MQSFQISVTQTQKAAGRFVLSVRRSLQKALVESGLSQSDVAREIGVHRSVISRELNGLSDMTLGRVAEIASALGRVPTFLLPYEDMDLGCNISNVVGVNAGFSSTTTVEVRVQSTCQLSSTTNIVVSSESTKAALNV